MEEMIYVDEREYNKNVDMKIYIQKLEDKIRELEGFIQAIG